ncbi:hypothetical protein P3F83_01725 [Mycobacteroides immunogenum]|uniref:hypothetical protein n=1 Tax=Mycobacteroides immunogenum TaxID=83262 RepID=UPI0025B751D6|nr:hypothetical protein [Mycobacteroides immunogenum]WJR34194.1 hypothetical protein P3F83_01725 [Mycobacteroides immunogenum]
MANDGWTSMSHGEIVSKLSALVAENAYNAGNQWTDIYTKTSDAADKLDMARQKLATEGFWTGKGPAAALHTLANRVTEYDDSETGIPALAGKMSTALTQDGETLTSAHHVAQAHPELGSGAPTGRKKEELEAIRAEAQRLYSTPLEAKRPEITDSAGQSMGSAMPQGPGANNSGGGAGAGGGGQQLQAPSGADGLANRETKPQLAGGDGQQGGAGQGQGQGAGQGGGSGGGTPGGGSGSGGSGSGSPFGGGKDSGSGLPVGSTTAAGFSPSATGTGAGGGAGSGVASGGLSALRGGGLPGGATGGTGTGGVNPAAMGATGVRGVGGPMGMMGGGAGAHGKGGNESQDEHEQPQILFNYDNTDELLGDIPPASPAVIGDFTEAEKFAKQKQEREIRRYKSMGWDVKFE